MNSQNQSQAQNYNRNVPQQASHTVIFNDQPRATVDHSGNYPFLQQNNITNNHHTRNQPPFSEDEDYCSQTQQRVSTNQQNSNWKNDQPDPIYQPDLLEPYTRNEETRQTRQNPTSYNN